MREILVECEAVLDRDVEEETEVDVEVLSEMVRLAEVVAE